jgi:hypothetical protein
MGPFNHDGYVASVTSGEPVARACEAIETTRKILGNEKRWAKYDLHAKRGGVGVYCLHGALRRAFTPDFDFHGHSDVHGVSPYVGDRVMGTALHKDQSPEENAIIAIALAIDSLFPGRIGDGWDAVTPATRAYMFNDHIHTTHRDIKAVLKLAKKLCYDFATAIGEDGGF